jgi:two-component system, cell cycle response regulator
VLDAMKNNHLTKILIADDDRSLLDLLKSNLDEWGFDVLSVTSGKEALQILENKLAPQMAVLDFTIAGMDVIEICRKLRETEDGTYKYIIILVAENKHDRILRAMDFGADDYLIKPFSVHELRFRLSTGKRIIQYHEELLRERENLRELTLHDSLTRLYNRPAILDFCRKEMSRSQRQKNTMSLMMVDVDHFKMINDTHGHLVGDAVLREIARRIAESLRPYDAVGRYGGEEFLVVVPNCDNQNALQLAERIRQRIFEKPVSFDECLIPVTISLGVAVCNGKNELSPENLIGMADRALYTAKNGGRNRIEICV